MALECFVAVSGFSGPKGVVFEGLVLLVGAPNSRDDDAWLLSRVAEVTPRNVGKGISCFAHNPDGSVEPDVCQSKVATL